MAHDSTATHTVPSHDRIAASLAASLNSEDAELMVDLFGKLIERHMAAGDCGCENNPTHSILDEIQLMIALELGSH